MTPFLKLAKTDIAEEYELMVYGQIGEDFWGGESVTAKAVAKQIAGLSAKVKTINVRINSPGGSVADGLAIYNALRASKQFVRVVVDGLAASAGSLIAMAGDEVVMPKSAIMMVHGPWTYARGNSNELRVAADVLDKWAESLAGAYSIKTKKPEDEMLTLLKDGEDHWYTAKEALEMGLIDVVSEDKAKSKVKGAFFEQVMARAPDWAYGMMRSMDEQEVQNVAAPEVEAKIETVPAAALLEAQAKLAEVNAVLAEVNGRLAAETEARELSQISAEVRTSFENVPHGETSVFAKALRSCRKADAASCAILESALKSANALLKDRLVPIGQSTAQSETLTIQGQIDKMAKAKREANPKLTVEQARSAVYSENPNLVDALRNEGQD